MLCLYSVADEQSLVYKEHIMYLYGIPVNYINSSPLDERYNSRKPYFNVQLDDKAGLNETIYTLEVFYDELKQIKKTWEK